MFREKPHVITWLNKIEAFLLEELFIFPARVMTWDFNFSPSFQGDNENFELENDKYRALSHDIYKSTSKNKQG